MTTTLFMNGRSQAVRLPKEYRMPGKVVSVRRVGDGIMIEPVAEQSWPEGFFDAIRISDDEFARPPQGETPASPNFDE
jgi:antitoxin VapB